MDFALVEHNNCVGLDEWSLHKKNDVPNPENIALQAEVQQLKDMAQKSNTKGNSPRRGRIQGWRFENETCISTMVKDGTQFKCCKKYCHPN